MLANPNPNPNPKDISLAKSKKKKAERNHIIHITMYNVFISMLTCSGFLVSLYLSTLTYKLEMITAPATWNHEDHKRGVLPFVSHRKFSRKSIKTLA